MVLVARLAVLVVAFGLGLVFLVVAIVVVAPVVDVFLQRELVWIEVALLQVGEQGFGRSGPAAWSWPSLFVDGFLQTLDHGWVLGDDGQLAPGVEAARRQVDRTDDGAACRRPAAPCRGVSAP